jgi:hypothetical protein
MKNSLKLKMFAVAALLLSLAAAAPLFAHACGFAVQSATVYEMKEGTALLRWTTPGARTNGTVYVGESSEALLRTYRTDALSSDHQVELEGLEKDKVYFYKIVAKNSKGETDSSAVRTFDTRGMVCRQKCRKAEMPLAINSITPVSYDYGTGTVRTVPISFHTNLPAKSRIAYGTSAAALNQSVEISTARTAAHQGVLAGLQPHTLYFFRIEAYGTAQGQRFRSETYELRTGGQHAFFPSGSLVRAQGEKKVYLIYEDTKAWIADPATFLGLHFKGEWIQDVPSWTLNEYREVSRISSYRVHPSGSLVKYAGRPAIYLIAEGKKRPIASPDAFVRNGFRWDRVVVIADCETYPSGQEIG